MTDTKKTTGSFVFPINNVFEIVEALVNMPDDEWDIMIDSLKSEYGLSMEDLIARRKKTKDNNDVFAESFWNYIHDMRGEKWDFAFRLGQQYHDEWKNPDDYLDEIKNKVESEFKTKKKKK